MSRNHSLANKTAPLCWTCGKKPQESKDWLKCNGCEAVQCSSCDECLVSFFISFCESCNKEYCNLCSEKDSCPDCGRLGNLVYAYGEHYTNDRKEVRIKGYWYKRDELTEEMIQELMT
jgi:hypothetical protein